MIPIHFEGVNTLWAKNQDEYVTTPAFVNKESEEKESISCWKLTWKERLVLLISGRLWICQLTFGNDFQPMKPTVRFKDIYRPISQDNVQGEAKSIEGNKPSTEAIKRPENGKIPDLPEWINEETATVIIAEYQRGFKLKKEHLKRQVIEKVQKFSNLVGQRLRRNEAEKLIRKWGDV